MPSTRRQLLASAAALGAASYLGKQPSRASNPDGPNVLVIVVDTLRADHVFDGRARTPNIDALAAEGLSFTRFFPEAMPTVPARNSILSGRRMFPFRDWQDHRGLIAKPGWAPLKHLDGAFSTVLGQAGWWTGLVTDNPFLGFASPYEPMRRTFDLVTRHGGQIGGRDAPVPRATLDRWIHPAVRDAGMADRVRRYIANADYSTDERRSFAAQVFRSAVGALEVAAASRPFLLFVDTFEPHEPWTPPHDYLRLFGDAAYLGPEPAMPYYGRVENWLGEDEAETVLARLRAVYAAEVTMTDRWLGTLLERLHELRLEHETVIVLVSDHGFQLGERGWTGKISAALHPELIQVPLVIVAPDHRASGTETEWFASTHDIAPTILGFAGVEPPGDSQGTDLRPLLDGSGLAPRPYTYGGYSDHHFLRTDRWAYMSDNRRRRPQLFDLRFDPDETQDVSAQWPDVVEELFGIVETQAGGDLPSYSD